MDAVAVSSNDGESFPLQDKVGLNYFILINIHIQHRTQFNRIGLEREQ